MERRRGLLHSGSKKKEIPILVWVTDRRKYASGYVGKLNRVKAFRVFWNGSLPKGTKDHWQIKCFLPGTNINDIEYKGTFADASSAKAKCEEILKIWLEYAGVQIAETTKRKIRRRQN